MYGELASVRGTVLPEGMTGEQVSQRLRVDASFLQCSVEAAPAAPMEGLQTQMDRRECGPGHQDGICQFEQRVGTPLKVRV